MDCEVILPLKDTAADSSRLMPTGGFCVNRSRTPYSGEWPRLFSSLHYGFTIKTHRPYRPRTKGKVERAVDYVKENFLNGRSFSGFDDLNAQGLHWLNTTANLRLHATTKERPLALLEKEGLISLNSIAPYAMVEQAHRRAGWDATVRFDRSRYSIPPQYAGKAVSVEAYDQRIVIRTGDLVIAEHQRATRPNSSLLQPEHLAALWQLSLKQPAPQAPCWHLSFSDEVAVTPLEVYEQRLREGEEEELAQ
jgi:hypothetical protein